MKVGASVTGSTAGGGAGASHDKGEIAKPKTIIRWVSPPTVICDPVAAPLDGSIRQRRERQALEELASHGEQPSVGAVVSTLGQEHVRYRDDHGLRTGRRVHPVELGAAHAGRGRR